MNSARWQRIAPVISQAPALSSSLATGSGLQNAPSKLDRGRSTGSTHTRFLIVPPAQGITNIQRAPYYHIPEGCMVRARATSNQPGGNTSPVYLGVSREQLGNAPSGSPQAIVLQNLDDVQLQVANMNEIWFYTLGATDGLELSVQTLPAPQ